MKFSFVKPHVWMQHALCLYSIGQYAHALSVLKEVSRLPPIKVIPVFWQHKYVAHVLMRLERALTGVPRQWVMSLQIHRVYYPHVTFTLELALIYRQLKNHFKKEKQLSSNSAFVQFWRSNRFQWSVGRILLGSTVHIWL